MTIGSRTVVGAFGALLLIACDAAAQPPSSRELDAVVQAFGGWDVNIGDVVSTDESGAPVVADDTSIQYGGLNGSLHFSRGDRSTVFTTDANASVRTFSTLESSVVSSYGGGIQFGSTSTARRTWGLTQQVSYAPINLMNFLPGSAVRSSVFPVDYRISDTKQLVLDTGASFGYRFTRSQSVSFTANYNTIEAIGDSAELDTTASSLRRWSVGGRYTRSLTRYSSVYGGYTHSQSRDATTDASSGTPTVHNIDVGFAYRRPLSFSRRTMLAAEVGSTAIDDGGPTRRYDVVGNLGLDHQIGRTWNVQGAYNRTVRFVPAFADPVQMSGFTGGLTGRLGDRSSIGIGGDVSTGQVGTGPGDNSLKTYSATAQFRRTLAARVGVYVEYFLFNSDFGTEVPLPEAVSPQLRRNGIRFGLTIGTSLLGVRR